MGKDLKCPFIALFSLWSFPLLEGCDRERPPRGAHVEDGRVYLFTSFICVFLG